MHPRDELGPDSVAYAPNHARTDARTDAQTHVHGCTDRRTDARVHRRTDRRTDARRRTRACLHGQTHRRTYRRLGPAGRAPEEVIEAATVLCERTVAERVLQRYGKTVLVGRAREAAETWEARLESGTV